MGFQQNSVNVFSNNTLQSTCVIKMQSEDRLMIHSNCVNNPGTDDILATINSTTSLNYSSINYQCPAPDYYSKVLNSQKNNTYSFQLTDENANVMDLNGLNMNFTLVFFQKHDLYKLIEEIMRLVLKPK
jgi:hypothetical protein